MQLKGETEKGELRADTAKVRPVNTVLPRRARTRQGRTRLLTLEKLDKRTAASKAAHSLVANLTSDLGGADHLTTGELELVKRVALTGALAADFEARWVAGQEVELSDYLMAVNVQRRLLATLGLERRAKDVGPSLGEMLRRDLEHVP